MRKYLSFPGCVAERALHVMGCMVFPGEGAVPGASHEALVLPGMSHERPPPISRGISLHIGGAKLVAVGAQSWYDWIRANDPGSLQATNGASINK